MLRYCPRWKLKMEEDFACIKCPYNLPITLSWKINCRYPAQYEWSKDFKKIMINQKDIK